MESLTTKADIIAQKVRHFLITMMGVTADQATDEQFYRALSQALREEIMINWTATTNSHKKKGVRKVYYLSMEYMPGRLFGNNVTNLSARELVKRILKLFNRNFNQTQKLEPDIGIGNGGLGRLASCFLDSLATLQYPARGYGMRYQYGIFEQELIYGVQLERPDCWLLTQNPWEFRQDSLGVPIQFFGKPVERKNSQGNAVLDIIDAEEVRALPYDLPIIGYGNDSSFSVLTLRLWSTKESPRNFLLQRYNAGDLSSAAENTSLTDVLYPNDNHTTGKRIRLKQEFLLLSASLQDIFADYNNIYSDFNSFADTVRIQINDTHPALVVAELMRKLTCECNKQWGEAWEITKTCLSYTNHTVLKEALEEWNVERVKELLPRQYHIIERINQQLNREVSHRFPNDEKRLRALSIIEGGQIRMANLAIYGSHKVNGVAKLHTKILKTSIFKDFHTMYPDRFFNVTNGITQRRWLLLCNPLLVQFLEKRIGNGWITDFKKIASIADFASDRASQEEFLEIKKKNKERLLLLIKDDMKERHGLSSEYIHEHTLGPDALFDVHIKRIHEYKRQLMNALHLLMLYYELKETSDCSHRVKRFSIFSGKAAPGYTLAKNIIRFIYCLARKINHDQDVKDKLKIVFIENYNVSKAEVIIPGTDLSEQISTAGMEASGTGNMKLTVNGALTIGTDDGANVEMRKNITDTWWPFLFGKSAKENVEMHKKRNYNPLDILAKHPQIKRALTALTDGSLTESDAEHEALLSLYSNLTQGPPGAVADRFFVLNDLWDYYETQQKVDQLYKTPLKWAEYALHNIAGMGPFSGDYSIKNYAKHIWDLKKCPPDPKELEKIKKQYSENDRCRVIPS